MQETHSQKTPLTIEVTDILEVLEQHRFSNQKQIELLETLYFALYKKHYPQDLCGIIKNKIQLLKLSEQETTVPICPNSPLCPHSPNNALPLSLSCGEGAQR